MKTDDPPTITVYLQQCALPLSDAGDIIRPDRQLGTNMRFHNAAGSCCNSSCPGITLPLRRGRLKTLVAENGTQQNWLSCAKPVHLFSVPSLHIFFFFFASNNVPAWVLTSNDMNNNYDSMIQRYILGKLHTHGGVANPFGQSCTSITRKGSDSRGQHNTNQTVQSESETRAQTTITLSQYKKGA